MAIVTVMKEKMTIAKYLIESLKNIGVKHAFGVPGDYVLDFMDRVIENGLDFIGTCNELNAGYAADGYARANGAGAAIVTYGVGGLSILNAVAGAYAEQVPLIIISGAPHSRQKSSNALVHHLAGGYNLQLEIYKKITIDSAVLDNPGTAGADINRVLKNCLAHKRPVYFEIPVDAVDMECNPPEAAQTPKTEMNSNTDNLAEAAKEAAEMINAAKNPVVIIGVEVLRFQLAAQALKLVETVELPYATTISSKSVLPELHPQFIGLYQGAFSRQDVREQVETSDCILSLGVMMNDFNLGMFTSRLDPGRLIDARTENIRIRHHSYDKIRLDDFLKALLPLLKERSFLSSHPLTHLLARKGYQPLTGKQITIRRLFERINNILDDQKLLVCDTGDAICAATELYVEEADNFVTQAYYLSIGYSLPATLGLALAKPEKRIIDVIGDGAFQMTAQELSTIVRKQCHPIIFLLNNQGYVIERMIHDGPYNDIQNWQYSKLAEVFTPRQNSATGEQIPGGGPTQGFCVRTEDELERAVDAAFADKEKCALIEVLLDPTDCSVILTELGRKVRGMSK